MMNFKNLIITGTCLSLIFYSGCAGEDEPAKIDCSKSDLALTFESVNPESCTVVNGSITASVTGGKAPYTYALNAGVFGSNAVFTQLSTGNYILRVKDKNGCTVQSTEIQLRIPGNDLNLTAVTEPDTECIGNNGTIALTATGGTEPYQYQLNTGAFGSVSTFTSVATGNYTVTVKDAEGCVFPQGISVGRGNTGTSLTDDIMPIIQAKCAIDNCHNGSQSPNLSTKTGVLNNAAAIKGQTQSGRMPQAGSPGGSLTTTQKALIACWVDDGATNN
jgi:hypothetical protein